MEEALLLAVLAAAVLATLGVGVAFAEEGIPEKVKALETKVAGLESKAAASESKIAALETKGAASESKIAALEATLKA